MEYASRGAAGAGSKISAGLPEPAGPFGAAAPVLPADGPPKAAPPVRRKSNTEEIHGLDVWSYRARLWAIRRLQRAWTLNPGSPVK
jgi:hypothetical protein